MEELLENIMNNKLMSLGVAIGIIIVFRIFASIISYIIIKMFNLRKKTNIKKNVFYSPLKSIFTVLGIYLAILFLREPLSINEKIINLSTKIFKITSVIIISKGIINSLTAQNSFISKMQKRMKEEGKDSASTTVIIKVLKVLIYIVASVIIIQEIGYDLSGLITGLGLGGVILTLAAQDTAKNLFGGAVIFLDKPFKVGDYIKLPTCDGVVEDITFRSTRLRTLDNCLLHIPNSEVSSAIIINYSEMQKRRYLTNLTIELGTPLTKINKLVNDIENMLNNQEKIIKDSVSVKFQDITDNGSLVVVIAYLDIVDYGRFLNEKQKINYNIMNILEEDGVKLAYNTQTIHIKNN